MGVNNKMASRPKLAVVATHPTQHYAPVYRRIAETGSLDLSVFYYSDCGAKAAYDPGFGREVQWDVDLTSGYPHQFLEPGSAVSGRGFWAIDSSRLVGALERYDADAVLVYGYSNRMAWRAWRWAARKGRLLLYVSDTNVLGDRGLLKRAAKQCVLRYFFRNIGIFCAASDRNLQYLKRYGASESRIRRCPLPVDLSRFTRMGDRERHSVRREARKRHGIPEEALAILFCGKLVPWKRPKDVLEALKLLKVRYPHAVGVVAGSGPLEEALGTWARDNLPADSVRWLGFVNQSDILSVYRMADVVAIPSSREPHGLVATEAAACGLPIIASDRLGCIGPNDVVRHEVNGLVYRCGNVHQLAESIAELAESPAKRKKMGEESLRIAETQDVRVAATAIEDAVLGIWASVR